MMNRVLHLLILLLILFQPNHLFAQQKKRCGTTEYMAGLKVKDPALEGRLRQAELLIQQAGEQNLRTSGVSTIITIPVVFHILYNNAAQNISQSRVLDQVATLNKDFARLNADSNSTPAPFRLVAANTQIQFCLAKRDPNGDSTNGIIRIPVTVTGFDPLSNEDAKFTSSGGDDAWPRSEYLNIWVAGWTGQAQSSFLLGTTQFPDPDPGSAPTDGIMVLFTAVGGNSSPGTELHYNLGRTLTHEVGHWLALFHTWGDDGGTCAESDSVSDTPNQASENYFCPGYPHTDICSPLTPGVMYMNYMDYVYDNCMNLFTQGQAARMHNAITALRPTISTSNGCLAPDGIAKINSPLLSFNVFPNPASESITVSAEFKGRTDAVVTISNMMGEIVFNKELKNVSDINLPVDVSEKAQGVYNLSLRTTNALVNKKNYIGPLRHALFFKAHSRTFTY